MVDDNDDAAELARRIRTALRAGTTMDDVLAALRADGHGPIRVIDALRRVSRMSLGTAKVIVSSFCEGRSYAQLTLADEWPSVPGGSRADHGPSGRHAP